MLEKIKKRFGYNIGRVNNLMNVYDLLSPHAENKTIQYQGDVLRAAVVLLHATLEDLLRSLLRWKLPSTASDFLKDIPFDLDNGQGPKGTLLDLQKYKEITVSKFIENSVQKWLDSKTYNKKSDIYEALNSLGISEKKAKAAFDENLNIIEGAMKRRHKIVHESDRFKLGKKHGSTISIEKDVVQRWAVAVDEFGKELLKKF